MAYPTKQPDGSWAMPAAVRAHDDAWRAVRAAHDRLAEGLNDECTENDDIRDMALDLSYALSTYLDYVEK